MEKRAVLAFVISVVIITVWTYFFSPQPEVAPPSSEPAKTVAPEAKAPQRPPIAVDDTQLSALKSGDATRPERTVTVETPLYVAQLNSRGSTLMSWKLKNYRESLSNESPPMEMVTLADQNGLPLELRINEKVDAIINGATFQFDREAVHLNDPNGQAKLKATLPLPSGGAVSKEFTFYGDRYSVDLSVTICDAGGQPIGDRLGILLLDAVPHPSSKSGTFSGPVAVANHGFEEIEDIGKFASRSPEIQWAGFTQSYFLSAIVPLGNTKKSLILDKGDRLLRMTLLASSVAPPGCEYQYQIYMGPKSIDDLKMAGNSLDKALNYGFFDIIARPLLIAMKVINDYAKNYGIAIIILTIVIKLLFWPLTHKSYASMKEMQRIQPRIKQLRERFKNDKEQLNREMMLLYKTHKVNPLGGCLPMVLQIPVFFALYKALQDSIELRHAPFIFWVKDLAAPDYLLKFPAGVNLFGIEGIGPLPLLMGVSMVIQQKMTPTMGDPTQAKIMMLMPIFFTFLFISFPSGLVLYWLINNVLSIVQQIYINSKLE